MPVIVSSLFNFLTSLSVKYGPAFGLALFFALNLKRTMTKAELVGKVASTIKLTKKDTEVIVGIIFQSITDSLSEGDKVELRGFGSFRIRERNARTGRNPKSGEQVEVPVKQVPFFKAGKELRKLVDEQGS